MNDNDDHQRINMTLDYTSKHHHHHHQNHQNHPNHLPRTNHSLLLLSSSSAAAAAALVTGDDVTTTTVAPASVTTMISMPSQTLPKLAFDQQQQQRHHRRRHIPVGPAGVWFQAQQQQYRQHYQQQGGVGVTATSTSNSSGGGGGGGGGGVRNRTQRQTRLVEDQQQQQSRRRDDEEEEETGIEFTQGVPNVNKDGTTTGGGGGSSMAFYSPAWIRMQQELGWVSPVIPAYLATEEERYAIIRPHLPTRYLMITDIHNGKADWQMMGEDQQLLVLVHTVESFTDHLWVATLTDETGACIHGWIRPKLVQQEQQRHVPRYTRPGVVWLLRGCTILYPIGGPRLIMISETNIAQVWVATDTSLSDTEYIQWMEKRNALTVEIRERAESGHHGQFHADAIIPSSPSSTTSFSQSQSSSRTMIIPLARHGGVGGTVIDAVTNVPSLSMRCDDDHHDNPHHEYSTTRSHGDHTVTMRSGRVPSLVPPPPAAAATALGTEMPTSHHRDESSSTMVRTTQQLRGLNSQPSSLESIKVTTVFNKSNLSLWTSENIWNTDDDDNDDYKGNDILPNDATGTRDGSVGVITNTSAVTNVHPSSRRGVLETIENDPISLSSPATNNLKRQRETLENEAAQIKELQQQPEQRQRQHGLNQPIQADSNTASINGLCAGPTVEGYTGQSPNEENRWNENDDDVSNTNSKLSIHARKIPLSPRKIVSTVAANDIIHEQHPPHLPGQESKPMSLFQSLAALGSCFDEEEADD